MERLTPRWFSPSRCAAHWGSQDNLADTENEHAEDLLEHLEAQSARSEIATESPRLEHQPWPSTGTGDRRLDVAAHTYVC